ncbi:MAG: hypothetical protein K2M46_11375 [Lachnospiraceae bacterium]|nr:hypothetical protein [Lachnospiraceae bacterium]
MSEEKNLSIGGFVFETEEAAQRAKDELSGIDVVRAKMNMHNPQTVLEIYNKLIDKRLCKTPVGYSYLHDMQKYLKSVNSISDEDIRDIPIEPIRRKVVQEFENINKSRKEKLDMEYRKRYLTSLFFNLIFCIAVVIILLLATTGDSVNIINYENKLIDKYEFWEAELIEREKAVEEYEKTYGITP